VVVVQCPGVALPMMANSHGGSTEQGAWWQRITKRNMTN
jgi:hypothetical protein